jgi:hypothetical protein
MSGAIVRKSYLTFALAMLVTGCAERPLVR